MKALLFFALPLLLRGGSLEFTGWLVHWDDGSSMRSFEQNAAAMQRVAPGWYDCGPDGLPRRLGPDVVKPGEKEKVLAIARRHGVKVFALTANYSREAGDFDGKRVSKFLNDPALMRRHAEALVRMARQDGADGLDLDYESLAGGDRDAFSRFVELTASLARAQGLQTAVAVHPKTGEPGGWDGAVAQDWRRLGAAVDLFRPMTYDQHWLTSEAGPIASPAWVQGVLAFAVAQVPRQKIEMGIPDYGYDWEGKKGAGLGWNDFVKLRQEKGGGKSRRDRASGELTFKYGKREVWYADSQAMLPKFALAKRFGVRGLALWRLGSEDPDFWKLLARRR